MWDLRTLKCLDTLSLVHTGVIYDVMVHNDQIFTASQDSTIRTWSNRTYNPKDTCGEVGGGQVSILSAFFKKQENENLIGRNFFLHNLLLFSSILIGSFQLLLLEIECSLPVETKQSKFGI